MFFYGLWRNTMTENINRARFRFGSFLTMSILVPVLMFGCSSETDDSLPSKSVFDKDNLVAWCIVPFDPSERNPQQRAEMLERLGIKKVAYDWRDKHIPTFEEEILQYKKHGLEYFAFWSWHDDMVSLVKKHGITPQFWIMIPEPAGQTYEDKVRSAGQGLLAIAGRAKELDCKIGLYNHGGWGGEPKNMAAVCHWLINNTEVDNVGIVYNQHHGHGHIEDFQESLAVMKPYLLCLNLNGMNDSGGIVTLGYGEHDLRLMKIIARSGYNGPIGILDHRVELDTEESLKENLQGMKKLLAQMQETEALKTYR